MADPVLEGRRLRISAAGGGRFDVAAVATSHTIEPQYVALGQVERINVSTDSRLAGSRLRRRGKGRAGWRAIVPRADHDAGRGQLVRSFDGGWRVEWSGQDFDRRQDAVDALVEWHDHPERREAPAKR